LLRNHFLPGFVILVFLGLYSLALQPNPDPQLGEALDQAADAIREGKYPQAQELLKKILKRYKDCSVCWVELAYSSLKMGKVEEASKAAGKALDVATSDVERATAHNLRGEIYFATGISDGKQLAKAEAEFREAVRLTPENAIFHLNLAHSLLKQSKDDEACQELKNCLALHPSPQDADFARRLLADPKRGREELAPDFQLTTVDGRQLSLPQLAGRLVVMDFWATWCPACRESIPELRELSRKYPDQLVLISVSEDNKDAQWRDFVSKHQMTWNQYRDSDHHILDAFNVHAFPTYLVIDGDGVVKQRFVGMNPEESIVHRLKQYLDTIPQLAAK
jgi:thioredoxin-like negative regulator of GroEL